MKRYFSWMAPELKFFMSIDGFKLKTGMKSRLLSRRKGVLRRVISRSWTAWPCTPRKWDGRCSFRPWGSIQVCIIVCHSLSFSLFSGTECFFTREVVWKMFIPPLRKHTGLYYRMSVSPFLYRSSLRGRWNRWCSFRPWGSIQVCIIECLSLHFCIGLLYEGGGIDDVHSAPEGAYRSVL